MSAFHERLRESLPRLTADNYRLTSAASWEYNCAAWAAGATDAWWWPVAGRYWPPGATREETLSSFVEAYSLLGYAPCLTADWESNLGKIAIYAVGAVPTHVARQMPSGWWTSKLGPSVDIEHTTPDAVGGGVYGEVAAILSRPAIE